MRGRKPDPKRNHSQYEHWNRTAADCYYHKMNCSKCNNYEICKKGGYSNEYNILQMKYALLMIYANNGTKGLEKYL